MDEFDLIHHFFDRPTHHTVIGIGDDAAVIAPQANHELHVSTDTLVADKHFFSDVDPKALGHKALAVNLSDLAAMGAKPRWALLSLSIPSIDHSWLKQFSDGFLSLARLFDVDLIGGDTVKGPLAITVTVIGETPIGKRLTRNKAQINDDLWVSGQLGLAALAVSQRTHPTQKLPSEVLAISQHALDWPQPRVALGHLLHGTANACIDISDGLLGDLDHVLSASQCGATLYLESIPTHPYLTTQQDMLKGCFLCGGDDYELLWSAPKNRSARIQSISQELNLPLTHIGHIDQQSGLRLLHKNKDISSTLKQKGFNHFSEY